MAMSAKQRSKFAALHRQLWRLHIIEKFSSGTITPPPNKKNKQTNKQKSTLLKYKTFVDIVLRDCNIAASWLFSGFANM